MGECAIWAEAAASGNGSVIEQSYYSGIDSYKLVDTFPGDMPYGEPKSL